MDSFLSVESTAMAAARRPMQASLEKANRSRENDAVEEVSAEQVSAEEEAVDERQIRERVADYFAILREWDLRLRRTESQDVPEFRQP
jgi:hypothetical protein